MKTTFIPQNSCPSCKYLMDAATAAEGNSTPAPGDFTVCFNCGTILRFTEHLYVREMEPEEMNEAEPHQVAMLHLLMNKIVTRGYLQHKQGAGR